MDIRFHQIDSLPDVFTMADVYATPSHLFVLREYHEVEIYDPQISLLRSLPLEKASSPCTHIYADDQTLLIGYDDGTVEIRLIDQNFDLLRISSADDAGGPGSTQIVQVAASRDFVFVLTHENGLLIYTKPSLLFYKWIMLGGHTEITRFSVCDNLLYVLTERPEHEIHMLDFDKHRIFEQEVLAHHYVDIEYDGTYLLAVTNNSLFVYLQEVADRPMKQENVAVHQFPERIVGLVQILSELFVVHQAHLQHIAISTNAGDKPHIELGQKFTKPESIHPTVLKYNFFTSQPHEHTGDNFHWYIQDDQGKIWRIDLGRSGTS